MFRKVVGSRGLLVIACVVALLVTTGVGVLLVKDLGNPFSSSDCESAIEQGHQVIVAVESFSASEGRLPESLSALVEKGYILSIPKAPIGNGKWIYAVDTDGSKFILAVRASSGFPSLIYDSELEHWELDQ